MRIRAEVASVLDIHVPRDGLDLVERLSKLTLREWETLFPVTAYALKETIRLQAAGIIFRKNTTGGPVNFQEWLVPKDAFVVYHIRDIHHDPQVYTEPEKFDPSRYLPDRVEDLKRPHGYIGFGSGTHPCRKLCNSLDSDLFAHQLL